MENEIDTVDSILSSTLPAALSFRSRSSGNLHTYTLYLVLLPKIRLHLPTSFVRWNVENRERSLSLSLSFFVASYRHRAKRTTFRRSLRPPFQKRGVRARGSWKMKCWNVAIKNPTSPPECSLGHVAYKTLVACSCSFFAARATNFSKLLHLWMVPPIPLDNLEEDAPVPKSRYTYVDSSDTYVDTGWFYVIIPLGRRTARSARGNESFTEHWTIGCNLSNGNGRGEVSLTACNVIYWRRKFSRIFLSRNGRTADRAFVLLREQAGKN